ncbi:NDP-hexose 2,3-dehydratase family protein [Actinoallomurus sp. NPDC050550]|uniref:NDP-hexose 2,3-dehydratase family protein n=1 Tax=Actinoallomurus sp. NPDC050550 TaxID=3154937 RepID=UPI00340A4DE7
MTAGLRPRIDDGLTGRLARTALAAPDGADVPGWLADWRRGHRFGVRRVPFAALEGWAFGPTGNLAHRSGRFFTVEGVSVGAADGPVPAWHQPIIVQPEVGVLGILAREFDGVLHFLMQAKMEPGNPGLVQLSPTVQATRSNYTKVHRGAAVPYLEYFTRRGRGRVLVDVLQSEHGTWFYRKSNRNMIIEVDGDVPVLPGFRWLTLGELGRLLHLPNVVNMDARTVLSCLPAGRDEPGAVASDVELLSWFTGERSRHELRVERIGLNRVAGWRRGAATVEHELGRYFRVVAVRVEGDGREVPRWSQPLIEPIGRGVVAFLYRRFAGVPHLLVRARVEPGFAETVELGPTVQCVPRNHAHLSGSDRPPFLSAALSAAPGRIRYDTVLSEEGGRFLGAESRYMIVEVDGADVPGPMPRDFHWVTPGQMSTLVRHNHYINVQARTLLAALTTGAAGPL